MRLRRVLALFVLSSSSLATVVLAATSPYAGEQTREIKALSASDIDQLRSGQGMGLARPAELNSYPGPRHVLDTAELTLTAEQTVALTRVFDAMKAAAVLLGEKIIAREMALDELFSQKRATAEDVRTFTAEIGRLQGELRAVHLNAHVATIAILTPAQVARYNQLRGYATTSPADHAQAHH